MARPTSTLQVTQAPSRWDDGKVAELLDQKASTLAVEFASGDSAASVTRNLTLPYKLSDGSGAKKSWSSVSWASSDPANLAVAGRQCVVGSHGQGHAHGGGPNRDADGDRFRGGHISNRLYGDDRREDVRSHSEGRPGQGGGGEGGARAEGGGNFTYESIKLAETGEPVGASALTGDVSLPKPAAIGVDGKYYEVKYTASTDAVVPNGWAGKVYRPLPG